jgi:P-type Cu+ transporter
MAVMAWRFITTGGVEMLRAHARRPVEHASLVQDPVCGMSVDPATAKEKVDYAGDTYYFCSAGCRSAFANDPARNAAQKVHAGHIDAGNLGHSQVLAAEPGGEMEQPRTTIDPVCGMTVDPDKTDYTSVQKGETYYFCSSGCKEGFDKDPAKYIGGKK